MDQLSLTLLGHWQVVLHGEPITGFRTHKVQALLAILATTPHQPHRREQLMTLLWPGMPDSSARANLRQVLFHLRQAIPDFSVNGTAVPLLQANRHTIQLNPAAPVAIDLQQFYAHLTLTQDHDHLDLLTCPTCYKAMAAAATLYQGAFLADFYLDDSNEFELWAATVRQQVQRQMLDALDTLTIIATRRQAYAEAREFAQRQLDIDNLHESAYRQLMTILALTGQRAAALALYDACRRLLAEELGMAPTAYTTDLAEQIRAGALRIDRPPLPGVRGYTLQEEMGAGAYGVIHRAVQPAIGREVAVKIIHPRYANDPDFIRRFEAEAQTVARLEHPHIVPLYDYWRESGGAFLVMRLLRGGNLLSRLADGPWSPDETARFLNQIAPALTMAHRQGVVHRDIKPANILFDEDGNAYLSDFGIAKDLARAQQLTAAGEVLGTLDYISPEQLQAGPVTPQSDIYSLGAVLYETLTGEKPFGNAPLAAVIHGHLSQPLPRIADSRPDLPARLDDVIQRATAKAAADRFPTALALAVAFQEAARGRSTAARPTVVSPPDDAELLNPYKGLRAYREADARDYYGREAQVARLIDRLADSRFLAVVGPSGSGKSSLVRAGLLPALRQGALPGSDGWFMATMVPGTHPLEELELALWPIAVNPPPSLVEPMQKDSRGLLRTVRRILPDAGDGQLLLVIDQFEELFTMVEDEERRRHFLASLLEAITAPRSPIRVVVTLRADFYDRPLQHQPLADLFTRHTEPVLPLSQEELSWAIQEPARRLGVTCEEGLLPAIVADVQDQPGALPLLQYALTELFASRRGGQMTRQAYHDIGGVPGALARRAEALFADLSPAQQATVRQLFLHLVTLGEGVHDTRRRVHRSDLQQLGADTDAIMARFGAARLLTFDHDPATRAPTVEVAHEALLRRWQRLDGWLADSRADIRLQRQLAAAAADWEAGGREAGYLLHGARLSQFEAWRQQSTVAGLPLEQAFLDASLAARDRRVAAEAARQQRELETAQRLADSERRRAEEQAQTADRLRRRALALAGAVLVAALLAGAALVAGLVARQNAQTARRSAAESRSLALAAGARAALADANTDLALTLALAAGEMDAAPPLARRTLYDVALAPGTGRQIVGGGGWRWSLDVSLDGRRVASGADDGAVTVWDTATGAPQLRLAGEHTEPIGDVRFTPDGRYVLSSAYDDQIILWDADTGAVVWRAVNPTGDPNVLAIAPDGALAAAGTQLGGVVTLWDVATGRLAGRLAGHDPAWQVLPVAFSPDGRTLASGSETGGVIMWDVTTQTLQRRIQVIDDVLFGLAFSPDGRTLAAGGKANAVYLYDVASGALTGTLPGLPDWLFDIEFSSDGRRLLVASRDGAVMVWDVATSRLQHTLYGEDGFPLNVAFLDGQTAVASYTTGNLRFWDLVDRRLVQEVAVDGFVSGLAQSSDGRLAAAGVAGDILLVDLESGETVRRWEAFGGDVTALAFDPAGEQLVSGTTDGNVALWNVTGGQLVRRFDGHTAYVHRLAFSPDGRSVLSASDDKQVVLWDAASGEIRFRYTSPTDAITTVAFAPDGATFAAGVGTTRYVAGPNASRQDNTIHLWATADGTERGQLVGHTGPVTAIAFSADGRFLLSGGLDATVRLWDVATATTLRRFDGHAGGVMSVAFSADGAHAASGAQDGVVIVWEVATGALLRQVAAHDGVVHLVAFTAGANGVWSGAEDGAIRLWQTALDEAALQAWTRAHRYVPPFECRQQLVYGLVPDC